MLLTDLYYGTLAHGAGMYDEALKTLSVKFRNSPQAGVDNHHPAAFTKRKLNLVSSSSAPMVAATLKKWASLSLGAAIIRTNAFHHALEANFAFGSCAWVRMSDVIC